jgi:hypothetical protein
MPTAKKKYRPSHGNALDDYILDNIGRLGILFHQLYPLIVDSYGSVSSRTVHRRLVKLRLHSKILKVIDSHNEVYYRFSKTS